MLVCVFKLFKPFFGLKIPAGDVVVLVLQIE